MGRNTHIRSHRFIPKRAKRPKAIYNWDRLRDNKISTPNIPSLPEAPTTLFNSNIAVSTVLVNGALSVMITLVMVVAICL